MQAHRLPRPTVAALAGVLLAWAWLVAIAPPAHANVSVIPYRSADWRFQVYSYDPPGGWQEPGFDDSGFPLGCAAFGTQGTCFIAPCTAWPLGTRLVLRKTFDVPVNTAALAIGAAFDNEIKIYINGVLVGSGGGPAEECSGYNRAIFNVGASLLQPTGNVIAVLGTDYGLHDLLDLNVEAVLSGPPPPPPPPTVPSNILSCAATDARDDAVVVTWGDVEREDGYRVYRDGALVATTGVGETSFTDHPPVGTFGYCVQAYNAVGTSNQCCDFGTRVPILVPSPCGASDGSSKQVLVTWTRVAGADGYHVYRGSDAIHTAGPDETYFVDLPAPGTYAYCVQAFNASGVSLPCCDSGTRLPLPYPSPCAASDDDPRQVLLTWTDVEGEDGYKVYRTGLLIHTTGPDETSYADVPPVGTFNYCVRAFNSQGSSADCCNTGTRPVPPGPAFCQASDGDVAGVTFSWNDVAGEDGYRVFRDGVLIHTAGPDQISFFDVPAPGTYAYCVEAFYPYGTSARCCDNGRRPALPAPGPCAASDAGTDGVTVTWTALPGADGYRVFRNTTLVHTAAAGATSYVDAPANGTYTYCVEAFNSLGTSDRCCDPGTRAPLPAPGSCSASDDSHVGVTVSWSGVPGAESYRVFRSGMLVGTVYPPATSCLDPAPPGTYSYAVAAYNGGGLSASCVTTGTRLFLLAPGPCAASDTDPAGVLVTWTPVAGADGYEVRRGSAIVHVAGRDGTSYFDAPPAGAYSYCVRAFDNCVPGLDPVIRSNDCCDTGARPVVPAIAWCRASDADPAGIGFEWGDVAGEEGYRVYRDAVLVQTLGPDQTSCFDVPQPGDYAYCVEAVFAGGVSPRCCDSGRRPALPAPATCSASDDFRDGVIVTWAAVPGAAGYRLLRDGAPLASVGPEATSYLDEPPAGTYEYCLEAFDAVGSSPRCCDAGTRPPLPPPGPCVASDAETDRVLVTWTGVAGAEGYRVYRDNVLVQEASAAVTACADVPAPGTYAYCVEAFASWSTSARCCDAGTRAGTPAPLSCAASDDRQDGVVITWSEVPGALGYRVHRDGAAVATTGPGQGSHYDYPAPGTYLYCVEAFDAAGPLAQCCDVGTRLSGPPVPSTATARLSWGSCDPQVADQQFNGPAVYKLVLSAVGVGQTIIGHDSNLIFSFGLADAWRFDDGGCQGSSQLTISSAGLSKSCPALLGTNPLAITFFGYDPARQMGELRMGVVYDNLTPAAATRYTLWQMSFDHSYSVFGPGQAGQTCGGAERGMFIDVGFVDILAASGHTLSLSPGAGDQRVTWNGGAPVRVMPVTWGKLKGLYR